MKELATRILWGLINPCRRQLVIAQERRDASMQQADQARSNAVKVADRVRASAEEMFDSIRNKRNASLAQEQAKVVSAVNELDEICATAKAHLESQGCVPVITATPQSESKKSTRASSPLPEHFSPLIEVSPKRFKVKIFCMRNKPNYISNAIKAFFVIDGVNLEWTFYIVFGLVFLFLAAKFPLILLLLLPFILWLVTVYLVRHKWIQWFQNDYVELVDGCQKLQHDLNELKHQMRKDTGVAIHACEQQIIPPAIQAHIDAVKTATRNHIAATTLARISFNQEIQRIAADFGKVAEQLHLDVDLFWKECGYAAKDWDSPEWGNWTPDASPEFAARIGTLAVSADDLKSEILGINFNFHLPALIPFSEGRGLLFKATGENKDAAAQVLLSVIIRALANTPAGKARFTLIDPVGLGHNVADFMHLGDFNPVLISGKAWTEPQHIEQQLTKLTEEMETVIQTFLRKKYATLQEYNKEHHEVAEPFRFLVIFDFPANFNESSVHRLISIVKNGPRCGVYTLLPVLVVIRNDSPNAIRLERVHFEYQLPDHSRMDAMPAQDVKYSQGPNKPKLSVGPLGGVRIKQGKSPLNVPEIEIRAFSVKMLPPGETASGFVYFETDTTSAGASLYVTGLDNPATGKELYYFEIPLSGR